MPSLRGCAIPRAYSIDLRQRVVASTEVSGQTRREIDPPSPVSETTLYDWLQHQKNRGSRAHEPFGGDCMSHPGDAVFRPSFGEVFIPAARAWITSGTGAQGERRASCDYS
jgi:hypothetical protein